MRYQTLLELRAHHAGYHDDVCTGVTIEPRNWEPSGARALARHRLVARQRPGGIDVLGPVDTHSRPVLAFEDLTLSFDLRASHGELALRTELAALHRLAVPTFQRPRSGSELRLRNGTVRLPAGVMAGIEIADVRSSWLRHGRHFLVPLAARQALWVYYLLTRRKGGLPRIVDSDSERALRFAAEPLADAEALAKSDPIGAKLLARPGERTCYRLAADRPLPSHSKPVRGLSLYLGDTPLVAELPSPSIHHHASVVLAAGSKPRDVLYSVLEY